MTHSLLHTSRLAAVLTMVTVAVAPVTKAWSAPATASQGGAQAATLQGSAATAPLVIGGKPEPDSLVLYFDSGSTVVRAQDRALLDQASRLYRDGHPVVMIVSGGADSVGSPDSNLRISELRASGVLRELVARGIPADRFQLLAKGTTDQPVHVADGVPEVGNRRVEIRWR